MAVVREIEATPARDSLALIEHIDLPSALRTMPQRARVAEVAVKPSHAHMHCAEQSRYLTGNNDLGAPKLPDIDGRTMLYKSVGAM